MKRKDITITVDPYIWAEFRAEAVRRNSNASREIDRLMLSFLHEAGITVRRPDTSDK